MFDNFIQDSQQKENNGCGINDMHYPKIKTIRPLGVFFPKKVHDGTKLKKSRPENNYSGRHGVF